MHPFISKQPKQKFKEYERLLKIAGSLSRINSDDKIPLLYFMTAETIFCLVFEADNISKSNISADAKKANIGIGIKTFHEKNGKSFQKIAEFNKSRPA